MANVPIPIVGSSNQGRVSKIESQRAVNWYPVIPEKEGQKPSLRTRPGLLAHCTLPRTPIRGMHVYNDRAFAVAGPRIYEIYTDGTYKEWGKINTTTGKVTMASLLNIIVIGDGTGYFALNLTSGLVAKITGAPRGRFCRFFNQRILFQELDSGRVYYSELNDATDVPALNFFTAEGLPDQIEAIETTEDQIWLVGADSTEPWYDSGDADNPFQRIGGGVVYSGTRSGDTVLRLDNSIWWVEKDKEGQGIVRRTQGFNPVRVSTSAVERFTATATNLSAYSYQEDGHSFYVLNADEGTWAFDVKTREWHERAWLNAATGIQERARPEIHIFALGLHLVSDYATGKIYKQSLAYLSDDGQEIRRTRITPHMDMAGRNILLDELYLDFATGQGLVTGQGSDPKVMLRYSTDGVTFSNELSAPLGKMGEYGTRVRFHRLGLGRDWTLEISVSDPVVSELMGAEARVRIGRR
jgi:hypothetical protein